MAGKLELPSAEIPRPRLDALPPPDLWSVKYERRSDTLHIQTTPPRAALSVDVDGELWVRVDPANGEVVGFEIEDFERAFLVRHPDIAASWRQARRKSGQSAEWRDWLETFLTFIRRQFADRVAGQQALPNPT
jgi:uncharacterized protein YuzE